VLLLGGMQMIMMGVLGEYLWRALDEARRRPRYIVEVATERLAQNVSLAPSRTRLL
jgi:dolichol-phosphate mannosyltransferase